MTKYHYASRAEFIEQATDSYRHALEAALNENTPLFDLSLRNAIDQLGMARLAPLIPRLFPKEWFPKD